MCSVVGGRGQTGCQMRVVSWNTQHRSSRAPLWEMLRRFDADVLLLQEVRELPPDFLENYATLHGQPITSSGGPQAFSTWIAVKCDHLEPLSWRHERSWVEGELARYAGQIPVGKVTGGTLEPLRVCSVYSPAWGVDMGRLLNVDTSGIRLEYGREIWVADLLLAAIKQSPPGSDDAWIIGGDFNLSVTFDMKSERPRGNQEYLDRMKTLGFTECLYAHCGRLTPTYMSKKSSNSVQHQMDHLFVTQCLADRLLSCVVGDADLVFGQRISDHLPIVADFSDWPFKDGL